MPSFHVSATFLSIFCSQMQSAFFLYSKRAHSQTYVRGHILKHIKMLVFTKVCFCCTQKQKMFHFESTLQTGQGTFQTYKYRDVLLHKDRFKF
jgi:hypothetical protein